MQVYTDPTTGRQYTVDPETGQSRWLDQPAPPPPSMQPPVPQRFGTQPMPPQGQPYAATGPWPGHGGPPPKKRTGLKVVGAVVGVLVVLGIIGSLSGGGEDTATTSAAGGASSAPDKVEAPSTKAKALTSSKPAQAVIMVTAAAFGDEFDDNQPAAEKKYNGKRVKVTKAKINNIKTGSVALDASSKEFSLTQISCDLADEDQALTVKNGQVITVTGTVDGQMMGVISLQDCTIG